MRIDESIAMDNSYKLITGRALPDKEEARYFIHNPNEPVSVETIKRLYNFYKSEQAWGRCVKLQTLLAKLTYHNGIKRLSENNS